MEDGLTGLGPGVDPDIEAGDGGVRGKNLLALFLEQRLDRVQLGLIEVEVIGHMPLGDDQRVHWGNGKSVADRVAKLVLGEFC